MRPIDADSIYPWYLDAFKENKELGLKGIKPSEPRFSMNDIKGNLDNIPTINYYNGIAEGPEIIKIEDITADELRDWMKHMEEGIQLYPDNSWTKVEDGLPDELEEVLCYYEYYRYGDYNCMYTPNVFITSAVSFAISFIVYPSLIISFRSNTYTL